MPAASFLIASLAALEPPRPPIERSLTILQTSWSLSAAPLALAAADQPRRPIVGPGEVQGPASAPPATPGGQPSVTVLPAAATEEFDELKDPAAEAASGEAAAAETPAITDATATASPAADPLEDELAQSIKPDSDPLEGFNRVSWAVSQALDKVLLRPLAMAYVKITPKPARDGLRNVLANWGSPIILANDLLQLKPKRAIKTLGRFLINTILGLGGLFDVAKDKKFNLPHHGNRFSNTLAIWGIKPGPYIYLPVLGPTTLRDETDRVQMFMPGIDHPLFRNGRGGVFQYLLGLEDRATNDRELKALLDDAVDPYATFRTTWLQQRQGEVEALKAPDGKEPGSVEANPLDDPLADPASTETSAPTETETPVPVTADPVTEAATPTP